MALLPVSSEHCAESNAGIATPGDNIAGLSSVLHIITHYTLYTWTQQWRYVRTITTDPDLLICRIMETHVIARLTWERAGGRSGGNSEALTFVSPEIGPGCFPRLIILFKCTPLNTHTILALDTKRTPWDGFYGTFNYF